MFPGHQACSCILEGSIVTKVTLNVYTVTDNTISWFITQEPFDLDSMPEYLMEELTTDGEEDQVEALGHCLRVLDLDNLLGTLYEFIETYVKHSPSNEKDWPYVECFTIYYKDVLVDVATHFA